MSGARGRRVRWGQNFLADPGVARRIVEWARPQGRRVLEIGPGRGALTDLLLERCAHLTLVEIDPELAKRWRDRAVTLDRLDVVEGDVLEVDFADVITPPTLVVANLPYETGTAILMRLLEHRGLFDEIVVMLQKEVCERVAATEGGKAYGLLAIHTRIRANVERGFRVAPGSFTPPPRVDSQMLRIVPLTGLRHAVGDPAVFAWLLREAFGQRRKMLRNTVGAMLDARLGPTRGASLLDRAGIAAEDRPEVVSVERFARLAALTSTELGPDAGAA